MKENYDSNKEVKINKRKKKHKKLERTNDMSIFNWGFFKGNLEYFF